MYKRFSSFLSCRTIRRTLANLFGVTPSTALRYADIVITVHYRPWFWPFPLTRDFRFFTRRLDQGGIEWFQKPFDADKVSTHS
jgi:hypothetical protein